MIVYIEYAFLENVLIDGVLLSLAFYMAKVPIKWKKILFSATLGGVFALVFPLLALPNALALLLKISVAVLLCLVALPKKVKVNILLVVLCFLTLTFCFGGALIAFEIRGLRVFLGFALLVVVGIILIKKLYQKRAVNDFIYDCVVACGQSKIKLLAFYDSGNFATFHGKIVHFISIEYAYLLWGDKWLDSVQNTTISTLSGNQCLRVFQADMWLQNKQKISTQKGAYFALAKNMLSREYAILLNSRVFEESRKG